MWGLFPSLHLLLLRYTVHLCRCLSWVSHVTSFFAFLEEPVHSSQRIWGAWPCDVTLLPSACEIQASGRWDAEHVGVSLTRSYLGGLQHAEAGPPLPLEIFNVSLLTCSSDGTFIKSATGVGVMQQESNRHVFLWFRVSTSSVNSKHFRCRYNLQPPRFFLTRKGPMRFVSCRECTVIST